MNKTMKSQCFLSPSVLIIINITFEYFFFLGFLRKGETEPFKQALGLTVEEVKLNFDCIFICCTYFKILNTVEAA